jgi:hypothetical protein
MVANKLIKSLYVLISTLLIFNSNIRQAYGVEYDFDFIMYKKGESMNQSIKFSVYDTICYQLKIKNLHKGSYYLTTEWYNPTKKLQEKSNLNYIQKHENASADFLSWLKLHKINAFARILSPTNFNPIFYGTWEIKVYLNGDLIVKKYFSIGID